MSLASLIETLKDTNDQMIGTQIILGEFVEGQKVKASIDELERLEKKEDDDKKHKALLAALALTRGGGGAAPAAGGGGFFGSIGRGLGRGIGIAAGLGGLGLGIGAFFAGLSAGDVAGSYLNADMSTIKKQMITLGEAFAETPTDGLVKIGGLLAAGGALGALFGPGRSMKAGFGMFAIGAGIGAFFAGLGAGEAGLTWLDVDGNRLKTMMINLGEGLAAFSDGGFEKLSALLVAGALFGQLGARVGSKAAVGMGLIGAGIGAFFGGLGLGDAALSFLGADGSSLRAIMVNMAGGLEALSQPDYEKLLRFGLVGASVATGMAALTFAEVAGNTNKLLTGITNFFSGDEATVYDKMADGLSKLEDVNLDGLKKFDPAADSITKMTRALIGFNEVDFGDVNKRVAEFGESMENTLGLLKAMYNGEKFDLIGIGDNVDFDGKGLSQLPIQEIAQQVSVVQSIPAAQGVQLSDNTRELENATSSQNVVMQDNSVNTGGTNITNSSAMVIETSAFDKFDSGTRRA